MRPCRFRFRCTPGPAPALTTTLTFSDVSPSAGTAAFDTKELGLKIAALIKEAGVPWEWDLVRRDEL